MKQTLLAIGIAISFTASGQGNNLLLDTVHYARQTYYEGKQIRLGEGVKTDKTFAYVMIGRNVDSLKALPQGYARSLVTVELVYKNDFGYVIIASEPKGLKETDDLIYIKVEHALYNKELTPSKHEEFQGSPVARQEIN